MKEKFKLRKIVKKNQVVVSALALMIAIAGYMSLSDKNVPLNEKEKGEESLQTVHTNDISNGDLVSFEGAVGNQDDNEISDKVLDSVTPEDKEEIGQAVFTSSSEVAGFLASAKLEREQARAKSKEALENIIFNDSIGEAEKASAIELENELAKNIELEVAIEQLLGAKGFLDTMVFIENDTVDVMVKTNQLSEEQKAQIEEIITRKTGMPLSQIVISTIKTKEEGK